MPQSSGPSNSPQKKKKNKPRISRLWSFAWKDSFSSLSASWACQLVALTVWLVCLVLPQTSEICSRCEQKKYHPIEIHVESRAAGTPWCPVEGSPRSSKLDTNAPSLRVNCFGHRLPSWMVPHCHPLFSAKKLKRTSARLNASSSRGRFDFSTRYLGGQVPALSMTRFSMVNAVLTWGQRDWKVFDYLCLGSGPKWVWFRGCQLRQ